MPYSIVEPDQFLSDGIFLEGIFLDKIEKFNWAQYRQKQVLVRGCSSAIFPPWAFMHITGKLAPLAKSIRYGNEHDNIVVFRANSEKQEVERRSKVLKK